MSTIFLVEDDTAIADIYETLMKKEGLDVQVFKLGQQVINKMQEVASGQVAKPSVILLDLILPDMNGVDVLKAVKANAATKDVRVFVLTNQEEANVDFDGLKPDKFIVKANMTPSQLLEVIKKSI